MELSLNRRSFAKILTVLVVSGASLHAAAARAAIDPAGDYVTGVANQVFQLANSGAKGDALRSKFAALLSHTVNLKAISKSALGSFKDQLPPGKEDEFYRLVGNYAASLFVSHIKDFRATGLDIASTSNQGKYILVNSTIMRNNGGSEPVRWRVSQSGGGYGISDVNVKGVWLTIAMRDRFRKVLTESGGNFDALFAELRGAKDW